MTASESRSWRLFSRSVWFQGASALFVTGWGANQFAPLLLVYRQTLGFQDTTLASLFGLYAFGLAPGLLLGGPLSDRYGRRRIVRVSLVLSLLASASLLVGGWWVGGLFFGRLLTGLAPGGVFAAGSAWVKELSVEAAGVGARRAAMSQSAGFGAGPLVSGLLAQWAPGPTIVPYLVHLLLAAATLWVLSGTPETVRPKAAAKGIIASLDIPVAARPRFFRLVLPMAPWVFASATIGFTVLPAHLNTHHFGWSVAFTGLITAATLATGVVVQPFGRKLGQRTTLSAAGAGIAISAGGCISGAISMTLQHPIFILASAMILGAGFGVCLVAGLSEVEQLADPDDLAGLVALYYAVAYLGIFAPYLLALLAPTVGYARSLLLAAGLAVATLLLMILRPPAGQLGSAVTTSEVLLEQGKSSLPE